MNSALVGAYPLNTVLVCAYPLYTVNTPHSLYNRLDGTGKRGTVGLET
jgi:hypothetical protein